jgi:hypothetical protein
VLANVATLLHATLRIARSCHSGPLEALPAEVAALARAGGEPVTELDAERGLVDRLRKRLRRHPARKPTALGDEEVVEDGAVLIQPFRLDEYA